MLVRSTSASRAQLREYSGGARAERTALPAVAVDRGLDTWTIRSSCFRRPGKYLARCVLNQVGLPPRWEVGRDVPRMARERGSILAYSVSPEVHADLLFGACWWQDRQRHKFILSSVASSDSMGGYLLGSESEFRCDGVLISTRMRAHGFACMLTVGTIGRFITWFESYDASC